MEAFCGDEICPHIFVYKMDQRGVALIVSTTLAAIPLITATILEILRQSKPPPLATFKSLDSSLLPRSSLERIHKDTQIQGHITSIYKHNYAFYLTPSPATMSYSSRPLPSHLRQASTSGSLASASSGQSPILLARINEKKTELENLKQLRDLSAGLAGQMQMLEEKLATLSDGTEGSCIIKRSFISARELTSRS